MGDYEYEWGGYDYSSAAGTAPIVVYTAPANDSSGFMNFLQSVVSDGTRLITSVSNAAGQVAQTVNQVAQQAGAAAGQIAGAQATYNSAEQQALAAASGIRPAPKIGAIEIALMIGVAFLVVKAIK